jgi:hypothetical protein
MTDQIGSDIEDKREKKSSLYACAIDVKNGCRLDLPDVIGEQQVVEVVDKLVKVAESSWRRGLWLPGVG